jgi:hypothetical protein
VHPPGSFISNAVPPVLATAKPLEAKIWRCSDQAELVYIPLTGQRVQVGIKPCAKPRVVLVFNSTHICVRAELINAIVLFLERKIQGGDVVDVFTSQELYGPLGVPESGRIG